MGKTKRTKTEMLQEIVNDYIADGQPWPAGRRAIAAWAIQHKRWSRQDKSAIDQCSKELAEAMRAEMETAPQGRTVRAKHCARITEEDQKGNLIQKTLWFDRSAPPDLMHIALQQLRKGILGDNKRLKTDQDSYNDNNVYGAHIQLSFDYEPDLKELEQASEYKQPDFDDEEDEDEEEGDSDEG